MRKKRSLKIIKESYILATFWKNAKIQRTEFFILQKKKKIEKDAPYLTQSFAEIFSFFPAIT